MSTPLKYAPLKLASDNLAPLRVASPKLAPVKFALQNSTFIKSAYPRVAKYKSAFLEDQLYASSLIKDRPRSKLFLSCRSTRLVRRIRAHRTERMCNRFSHRCSLPRNSEISTITFNKLPILKLASRKLQPIDFQVTTI